MIVMDEFIYSLCHLFIDLFDFIICSVYCIERIELAIVIFVSSNCVIVCLIECPREIYVFTLLFGVRLILLVYQCLEFLYLFVIETLMLICVFFVSFSMIIVFGIVLLIYYLHILIALCIFSYL